MRFSSKLLLTASFQIIAAVAISAIIFESHQDPDSYTAFKTGEERILQVKFGYENHTITTDDGYFLSAVRIRNPLIKRPTKVPVLFTDALFNTFAVFMTKARDVRPRRYTTNCSLDTGEMHASDFESSPLMLSNAGYDVWLYDTRGVERSNRAKHANLTDAAFWNFNLDTLTKYDFLAAVKYVKNNTQSDTIGVLGYSQGTFQILAALTEHSYLNEWLKPVVAMAPITYLNHARGLALPIIKLLDIVWETFNRTNIPFPSAETLELRKILVNFCTVNLNLCRAILQLTFRTESSKVYPSALSNMFFATSLQNLVHYHQLVSQTEFAKFDYGRKENLLRYGQSKPPRYDVSKITNKYIALVRGESDVLANPEDTNRFLSELKVPYYRDVFIKGAFGHLDFVFSKYSGWLVNKPILEIFEAANGCKKTFDQKTVLNSPVKFLGVNETFGLF